MNIEFGTQYQDFIRLHRILLLFFVLRSSFFPSILPLSFFLFFSCSFFSFLFYSFYSFSLAFFLFSLFTSSFFPSSSFSPSPPSCSSSSSSSSTSSYSSTSSSSSSSSSSFSSSSFLSLSSLLMHFNNFLAIRKKVFPRHSYQIHAIKKGFSLGKPRTKLAI